MAFKARLTTQGFDDFLEQIVASGKDVDQAADQALAAGGRVLLEGMQRRVPRDTGNLMDTLKIRGPLRDGNYHFVEVGLVGADAETARYGTAQEYGTSNMAAQPYIRPAMNEDIRKARLAMRKAFEELLAQ
jgi:HK97 gp10 family phage protein